LRCMVLCERKQAGPQSRLERAPPSRGQSAEAAWVFLRGGDQPRRIVGIVRESEGDNERAAARLVSFEVDGDQKHSIKHSGHQAIEVHEDFVARIGPNHCGHALSDSEQAPIGGEPCYPEAQFGREGRLIEAVGDG
jgi:hypothetical protein